MGGFLTRMDKILIDKSVFTHIYPFVKDEGRKVTIECDSGENWAFSYETNKVIYLDDKRYLMFIEELGEPRLLACDNLRELEPVRLIYPGLMYNYFTYVDVPEPSCPMKDRDGRNYKVTLSEPTVIHRPKHDKFHELVLGLRNRILAVSFENKTETIGAKTPWMNMITALNVMDIYRDPECITPDFNKQLEALPSGHDELKEELMETFEIYMKKEPEYFTGDKKKYAVIADIHGNWNALCSVLNDARKNGIMDFIFAGDYCLSGASPDHCIATLRSIKNKMIVRGNEEVYLENLIGKDQSKWTDGQLQISYWTFRNVSEYNRDYILSVPHRIDTVENGVGIHVAHKLEEFAGECELRVFGSEIIAKRYAKMTVDQEYVKKDITAFIEGDKLFMDELAALDDGIYIFGHSHIQWSYKVPGREVYLVNPGSCGLPLDGILGSMPYTIISIDDEGSVKIDECRVPMDKEKYIDSLKQTSQYAEARVWTEVIIRELETAKEHIGFFLKFVDEYARSIGDERRPFSIETWEKGYEKWAREWEL